MFKKDLYKILDEAVSQIEGLNYTEQFIELFPDFLAGHFPMKQAAVYIRNPQGDGFAPFLAEKHPSPAPPAVKGDSQLATYLRSVKKTVVTKREPPARMALLEKDCPGLFQAIHIDLLVPLLSQNKLYAFIAIESSPGTARALETLERFLKVFANIFFPMLEAERSQLENSRNYYKIFRMDRLAMVGELAASAAHEIKNPLAGISTFLKYFTELPDFKKTDIIEELQVMRDSVHRIDGIIRSLLSFSRFKKKKIEPINLAAAIESALQSMALKIPRQITVQKDLDQQPGIETDAQQLQQVLINILFNAVEAMGQEEGTIRIRTFVTGRDQLPSREMFNISIKDTGPGIPQEFKEKLFQPFQTTKEEGTGLGLYTCYGLMKSLGGTIKITSDPRGTEVILSLPYTFDDEDS